MRTPFDVSIHSRKLLVTLAAEVLWEGGVGEKRGEPRGLLMRDNVDLHPGLAISGEHSERTK
jgi:hypothetical protein